MLLVAGEEAWDVELLKDKTPFCSHHTRMVFPLSVNTHVHADHITGTGKLKSLIPGVKSVLAAAAEAQADVQLAPFAKVEFGKFVLEGRPTPGHTNGEFSRIPDDW